MTDVRERAQVEQSGAPRTEKKPKPGTRVTVHVYAKTDPSSGQVEWSNEWEFDGYSKEHGPVDVPQKKKDQLGTPMEFILHDETDPKLKLRFVDNRGAIWVSRTECPERKNGNDPKNTSDPEITGIKPKGNVLKVFDENEDEVVLHYNLRFEPDPNKYYYDPEIKNGGKV